MSERNLEALTERERACLAHLDEARKLGVSFSRCCREKEMSIHQWTWIGGDDDGGVPDSPSVGLDDRVRELS